MTLLNKIKLFFIRLFKNIIKGIAVIVDLAIEFID